MNKLLPAIVSDIDGVLIRGKSTIPNSDIVVQELLNCHYTNGEKHNIRIPFYLLTNGGGCTELEKANSLNRIMGSNFDRHHIFLNYTPLRPIMNEYQNKLILLCGAGHLTEIAKDCDLRYFYTIDEYSALFDQVEFKQYDDGVIRQYETDIKQRNMEQMKNQQIEAVFIVFDPIKWEESIQTICKLVKEKKDLPIYVVNNDVTYADNFKLPRLAFGTFTNALISILKKEYNINPNIIYYGKPSLNTYKYVQEYIHEKHDNIGNIYMIGDNPASDIRGANLIGWPSVLVRSGVFRGRDNDPQDPGKYVVTDLMDAYNKILQLEGLKVVQ
ncbi:unnamed protein product (macronuclear) [Paramecium tetraurelia]|uniref:Uncharacterized protein n=1 Tax=Paramecium tetraurelia TaxID=5888 RepID=A0BYJ5_PARTE|nr:uncharacterized protein GSPATT00033465001 [Paramecium tetraurelia]CAK63612.1 unnamed protein product [Paramecium tetraurelia]|eukprot:XP_001431010.1 hypothetical protein (macronuclear) [Paramecium tetraurelia strain d4-2]